MKQELMNLFETKETIILSFEEIKSQTKIDDIELRNILKQLELDGKIYYDEVQNKYYAFPSNFFVGVIAKVNQKKKDITFTIDGKKHHLFSSESLKEKSYIIVSKNAKGKYKLIKTIDYIINSSDLISDVEALFYSQEKGLDFKTIRGALNFSNDTNLDAYLKSVIEEGLIYLDQFDNLYYPITKYHIICKVEYSKNGLFVRINNEQIFLDENLDINPDDKVIFKYSGGKPILVSTIKNNENNVKQSLKNELIKLFSSKNISLTLNNIKKLIKYPISNLELEELLKTIELEGKLYYDHEQNLYTNLPNNYWVVKVECTQNGYLYIRHNDTSYFPNQEVFNGARQNDIIILEKNEKKFKLVKILKRFIKEIVCEVTSDGIKAVGQEQIKVKMSNKALKELNLPIGVRFLANIGTESFNDAYKISYIKTIGHKNDLNIELATIAYNNGFIIDYSDEEIKQAESMPKAVSTEEKINRVDLTNETIFTIDGEATKDIDDAVGIKTLENGNYELTVSIAAVAHYVKFKSPLWERAEKNTTSLYMINSVSHMLHPLLSNGICSLNPNEERLAKSFKMEIDKTGKIVNLDIFDSVIKSRKKMTYEAINSILVDNVCPEDYIDYLSDIKKMQELSLILTNRHQQDGSVTFDSRETKFIFDDTGAITGVEVIKPGPAEKIIENFMVACNEAVANYMLNLGITFVYRNHEIPRSKKISETINMLNAMGYHIEKLKSSNDPHVIQSIIKSISTKEEFFILSNLFLRTMQKAYFSTENLGHFALALRGYSQTTSPIRRFLDLLIQYILDNLDNIYSNTFNLDELKEYIDEMCKRASFMERCADKCELEADKLYMVDYCVSKPDSEYTAYIEDITPNYVIVKTPELIDGIVYFNDIDKGGYIYSPDARWLQHSKTKEKIKIGDKLTIKLKDFSREYRLLFFKAQTLKKEMILTREKKN